MMIYMRCVQKLKSKFEWVIDIYRKSRERKFETEKLTIEHVMPQKQEFIN